ncbi:MAG: YkvA family protein [Pseudomonadota bacterium]|nr:YkvA family protein [Pseudomonadota bacterium]
MKIPGRFLVAAGTAGRLRVYLIALWKLFRHPETPRPARWTAIAVIAYAVSPIDLIPDFIPVLGMVDDLIIIPLGIALVVRLTPKPLWESLLREAELSKAKLPRLWWGAVAIVLFWALLVGLIVWAVRSV